LSQATFQIERSEIKSLSGLVADKLMQSVMTGMLKPGDHLVQNELAAQFGVSRVAIRDALQELRSRGLAVNLPQKGVIVRPISKDRIEQLFAIRTLLEPEATRLATPQLDSATIRRLSELIKEQQSAGAGDEMPAALELDWNFHETIYAHCGNDVLVEMIADLWSQSRQARGLAQLNPDWGRRWASASAKRHRRILTAIRRGDGAEAGNLIAAGIEAALEELRDALQETCWWETATNDTLA